MKERAMSVPLVSILQVVLLLAPRGFGQGQGREWIEIKSPHFLVATDGSGRQGRQLAARFEAIRSVFEQTLGLRVESGKPFVVMGFKDEKSMRAAMPQFWEKKGQAHPIGWFLPGEDKIYAAIRIDAGEDGPYATVYHEYTHMVLDLNVPALPLWMVEGLAQFYGFSSIGAREVGLGRPDANCIMRLRAAKMIPLAKLFQVDHDSPYYSDADKAPTFYAQSWALTHYLMLAEKTETGQRNRLSRFLALRGQGVGLDEATRRVFGDTRRLQAELGRYVERSSFPYVLVKTKAGNTFEGYGARALSPAETAARLGDFDLHDHRPQDAKPLLEEAVRLQPGLASAQESLGFLFMRQGDQAEALRWFDRAIACDSQSFLAHYYRAVLTMKEQGTKDGSGPAEASLLTALRLNPGFAPAYYDLARLYWRDDRKTDRVLELARKAVDIAPGDFVYQMLLGRALVRAGQYDAALSFAKTMEQGARSQNEKNTARSFAEDLRAIMEGKGAGPESRPTGLPEAMENSQPPIPHESRPVSYAWAILERPLLSGNTLLSVGSGDAVFSSVAYDDVWTATLKALTEGYEILRSDRDSGQIIARPVASSKSDPASEPLSIRVDRRGGDVGVNIANQNLPLATRTSLFKSLFEDIAVILSVGGSGSG